MSSNTNKYVDIPPTKGEISTTETPTTVATGETSTIGSVKTSKSQQQKTSAERQIKFERAQKCLENAALVSKRIKEHRKATAELLGRPFEDDETGDVASEMASTMSEKTGYSVATDISTTLSVQEALNIPGISESLANTLKQKELLMERIKQYKEISKRPATKLSTTTKDNVTTVTSTDVKKIKQGKSNDVTQLQASLKEKENNISILQVKVKAMETTIMDLQEKLGEKDMIIEAKTKATTLMSDNLSKKEKDSLTLLEDTRQQMVQMQEKFLAMEKEWQDERQSLVNEIQTRDETICQLQEVNTILENSRFEITEAHSKTLEELEIKKNEIVELQRKLEDIEKSLLDKETKNISAIEEEKGSLEIASMGELTKKIELLELLNCQIRQTNKELEIKLATTTADIKTSTISSPKKGHSPVPTRKSGRNTAAKIKSPWSNLSESSSQDSEKKQSKNDTKIDMVVQALNKEILDKEYIISQKEMAIQELQENDIKKDNLIKTLNETISEKETNIHNMQLELENMLNKDTVKTAVPNENIPTYNEAIIKDLETKLQEAHIQIDALNLEIEAANKNMLKVKSNNKIKIKQMQKTIDNFSRISDANTEIIKLNEEVQQLTQKVAELEEEKGNLQLHLVDYDSGRLTESESYRKTVELESLAESRLNAISTLETQKFDLVQELHTLQQRNMEMEDKLADMVHLQSEHVCSEIQSVQLEEELDKLKGNKKELELFIENLKLDKEQMSDIITLLEKEKEVLSQKLDHYIQENIELTDKLEKLSAEKVSSAESIEIVDSLTTQEKLELEEYNKGALADKSDRQRKEDYQMSQNELNDNIRKLTEESAELNKKIELFTLERQEVMEKMNKINFENEILQSKISELTKEMNILRNNVDVLDQEKQNLHIINNDLNTQIEELKRERMEIIKETAISSKSGLMEDINEGIAVDTQQDEKLTGEKGAKGIKSVKQMTKEILKLKNVIKEREEEIADCQMKILSLEEQHQKQSDLMQSNANYEIKLKTINEEKNQLLEEINMLKKCHENESRNIAIADEFDNIKKTNEALQLELTNIHNQYNATVLARDLKIQELEKLLSEYENQIYNYSNTLQVKDKELTEYINQITKLNDVSHKLKSTIELLEEEKAKDQNAELIKSLNKQISIYQKTLSEYEEKLKFLDEEKSQLFSLKSIFENKNISMENDIRILQETLLEKQSVIKEMNQQQVKYNEDINLIKSEVKIRDEEIHEIKLQLRKESIENEKLRSELTDRENQLEGTNKNLEDLTMKLKELTMKLDESTRENNARYLELETKNKELLDKLKKFAITLKKKSTMYVELEAQFSDLQKQLQNKEQDLEGRYSQEEVLELERKVVSLQEELNKMELQVRHVEEQKSSEILTLRTEIEHLTAILNSKNSELAKCKDENSQLIIQSEIINNKIVELEIEQKNNINLVTKITSLETEISSKQEQIQVLLTKLETLEQSYNQVQFGHDAKIQERDLYIENLESEIYRYKSRIARLEESISVMEDRRHSLERKADQLDIQLQEKYKAYNEYSSQEDELVNRLAVLMDHDRVVEKQLHEIEKDNKELQLKIQNVNDECLRLKKIISDLQNANETLTEKASKTDSLETQVGYDQEKLKELENHLKRITAEHQHIIIRNKQAIEELEFEFNTQIENAIKEKKMLSEKYEKTNENVMQLEKKLQEYKTNINNLHINLEEVSKLNQTLVEKAEISEKNLVKDYTEEYINEINNLNAIINAKTNEITQLNENLKKVQTNNINMMLTSQTRLDDLQNSLKDSQNEINKLNHELNLLKCRNQELNQHICEKEDIINKLKEKKVMTFEMNIPKTEGMIISSKIEELSGDQSEKLIDMASLESQIVTEFTDSTHLSPTLSQSQHMIRAFQHDPKQTQPLPTGDPPSELEPTLVPKKAYLCYQDSEPSIKAENVTDFESPITDPFNSDEGWGFDESGVDTAEIIPGFSQLNNEILMLKKEKEKLQIDLEMSSTKCVRALKKLKELKSMNDMLSNELKISKNLSQTTFLDSAIEDELKIQIQELDKKVEQLQTKLNSEKRENELIKKQNEIFSNANEKLTEMKEKLDNEIELWKYKFKEVNDKISTLQWGAETKEETRITTNLKPETKEDLEKLEKENDELQNQVDQLMKENYHLKNTLCRCEEELICLKDKLSQEVICSNCIISNERINTLLREIEDLNKQNKSLKSKLIELENIYSDLLQDNKNISQDNKTKQQLEDNIRELTSQYEELKASLNIQLNEANNKIKSLECDLTTSQQKIADLVKDNEIKYLSNINNEFEEKYNTLNKEHELLKTNLHELKEIKSTSEVTIDKLSNELISYEQQIKEMNTKIDHLNSENDQLLTTVTELRSSVSTAVDQRGYEIAEMWKQHLAQREADFMRIEQDLKEQLTISENKYEQLLDNVQSSSQEETNKLVIIEQLTALQNKLKDKEDHLVHLQNKYGEVVNQIEVIRSEMEDEKTMHENSLLNQREEYEHQISEITSHHQAIIVQHNEDIVKLQKDLVSTVEINKHITAELEEMKLKIIEQENKIVEMTEQIRLKDNEIYQKTNDFTLLLSQRNEEFENVRKQLIEYEKKLEDLSYEKESELAILRLKMHENLTYYDDKQKQSEKEKQNLIESLNAKVTECINLNKDITELNKTIEENTLKLTEMQIALENQELEIVTLNDEVVNLQDLLKSSANRMEKHVTFSADTKAAAEDTIPIQDTLHGDSLDLVPKPELDLALYMLHQRDVRCEELTMELTQLLEERDTLQLRLSDSIRSLEDLKMKCKSAGFNNILLSSSEEVITDAPSASSDKEQLFVDVHRSQTSRSSSVSEADNEKPKLQAKLTELRSVKHNRDVRLRQDSEQRQMDMRLLQRDVANLPPEAAEQLRQAHHTLSRDSQSTPTVLLNWLRGKSTPKVVHM